MNVSDRVSAPGGRVRRRAARCGVAATLAALSAAGCMVGPGYHRPAAPTASRWSDAASARVQIGAAVPRRWWHVFEDPVLDELVERAYRQNLGLQAAAVRVVEARALRGVAIGNLFPQTQEATGSIIRTRHSLETGVPVAHRTSTEWQVGFDAAWELDLWGRFRRGVQAADARVLAAIADYDDVLVSLVAEVASNYVQTRVQEARLALAHDNVRVQRDSLEIARVRYEAGGTSDLDVEQATTLLSNTEAAIPGIESQLHQSADALSVLLGVPASDLPPLLGSAGAIPAAPATIAVGIPADMLRRRPDVRRAEHRLEAQSAQIGVAVADLLPHVELTGAIGLDADTAARLASGRSLEALGGPQFVWPVLNYGRLLNEVRFQNATFQELVALYGDTVLRAQQDVENALVAYVRGAEQVARLTDSVAAANRAVDLSLIQYREGAADYTRVLTTQQSKLLADDALATARGNVTLAVIALYKAFGGGWELRGEEPPAVPAEVTDEMRARTWWAPW